jgi:hypothetical protein
MEANPQRHPAGNWKKLRTPSLLPEGIERSGIDLGASFPSFRGSGSALSLTERASIIARDPLGSESLSVGRWPGTQFVLSSGNPSA